MPPMMRDTKLQTLAHCMPRQRKVRFAEKMALKTVKRSTNNNYATIFKWQHTMQELPNKTNLHVNQ